MSKYIVSIIFFIVALFLVEASPIGSHAVEQYNQGYGTFDMKTYDAGTVKQVLKSMEPAGFNVYKWYYVADYIFILAFGILQILLIKAAFSWCQYPIVAIGVCMIPILRGMADFIENSILLTTLFRYPVVNDTWIGVAAFFTTTKLLLIKVWAGLLIIGIIGQIVSKIVMRTR